MELTGDQRALRDTVRAMLARHQRRAPAAGDGPRYDPALWQRLCGEIGVAGLAVPQEYGGAAAGPVETHVVAEELGASLTPSPLLGSAVLATQALLASGDSAACQRLLPPVAAGTAVAALAWTPEAGHWDPGEVACQAAPPASPGGGWALAGTAHHVLYGDCADVLLVAARAPDGIGLFDVDPHQAGVTRTAVTAMDLASRLAVVRLDGAAGRRLGGRGAGAQDAWGQDAGGQDAGGQDAGGQDGRAALTRARDLACIALSAEQAGAARRALELTTGYAKVRVQFGRPIGGFQAIAHRLADLHVLVQSARSLSYAAAAAAAEAPTAAAAPAAAQTAGPGLLAAAAKVYCSEAFARVAAEMIQLHGALGITWEHDAHHFLKRAHATGQLFGPPAGHAARIAAAVIGG